MLNGPHWLSFIILDYKHAFFPKRFLISLKTITQGTQEPRGELILLLLTTIVMRNRCQQTDYPRSLKAALLNVLCWPFSTRNQKTRTMLFQLNTSPAPMLPAVSYLVATGMKWY